MVTPTTEQPASPTSPPAQPKGTTVALDTTPRNGSCPKPTPPVPSGMWRTLAHRGKTSSKLPKGLDAMWNAGAGYVRQFAPRRRRYLARAARVLKLEATYNDISDARLRERAAELRELFRLGRQTREDVEHAFAVVREVAWRKVEMRPYKVQVAAALAMYDGCIAELATGEGKTLSASMPATVAGWRGRGVHVITVNDYLAARDAELMRPIYEFCGLTVSSIVGDTPPPSRRELYLADITYTTNKEVAADFLRDRLALGDTRGLTSALVRKVAGGAGEGVDRVVQRGLEFAIIDEADSIMIDEAVTPLIISGESPNAARVEAFKQASDLADQLEKGKDYKVDHEYRDVEFTNAGRRRLAELASDIGGIFAGARRREEMVHQAITARELYTLEKQYVIQDDEVVIVDEFTGRLMPDREWRDGLHQAVSAKEGVEVKNPKETLSRISFQNFYRMYKRLSGMTATAWEARHELWQIYGLPVVRIPTNRPCIRIQKRDRMFVNAEAKWNAIAEHVREVHATGQPLLVGTRSVRASELLSMMLGGEDGSEATEGQTPIVHRVLNAVRHKEEAEVVAVAGQPDKVTVATNMAGRGTDIKLGPGVPEKGGLYVLATERHENTRVDRQLYGRSARQGDPGEAVTMISLDDEILQRYSSVWWRWFLSLATNSRGEVINPLRNWVVRRAQARAERNALRSRKSVLKTDDWLDEALGFAAGET